MSITSLIDRLSPSPGGPQLDVESPAVTDDADAWDLLRNRRRRQVIVAVANTDDGETTTTREVAERIAAYENDKPVSELSSTEYKRIRIGIYQEHLPRLDDAGIIDYDQSRNTIEATETTEAAARLLATAHGSAVFQRGDEQ